MTVDELDREARRQEAAALPRWPELLVDGDAWAMRRAAVTTILEELRERGERLEG